MTGLDAANALMWYNMRQLMARKHRLMKDNRGTTINIGDKVAYNRSGYLEHGEVIKFTRPTRYRDRGFIVKNTKDGKESRVKDRRSILVLFEPCGQGKRDLY